MDEPTCPGCRALQKLGAELRAQVAELPRRLEEAVRAGKRPAAPLRKGPPKPKPQRPGRKAGDGHGRQAHRPSPKQLTDCHDVLLPDPCPHCRGQLAPTTVAEQMQTEIPRHPVVRQSRVHIGHGRNDGGNRTGAGAQAQGVLVSVLETCRRQARSALDHAGQTLRAVGNLLRRRPVLLPAR